MLNPATEVDVLPADQYTTHADLLDEIASLRHTVQEQAAALAPAWNDAQRTLAANALMRFFAAATSRRAYLAAVTRLIHLWTGCRHVGIRVLSTNGEIPFRSYLGFSREFWETERCLNLHTDECLCTRIINGQVDPQDQPYMTRAGSYVIDDSQAFNAQLPPAQRRRYRGTCVHCGLHSLAIIPVVHQGKVIGLIHAADQEPGKFPPEFVLFLEELGLFIGQGLAKFHGDPDDAATGHLQLLMERSLDSVTLLTLDGHYLALNTSACLLLRCDCPGDFIGHPFTAGVTHNLATLLDALGQAAAGHETGVQYRTTDRCGRPLWYEATLIPVLAPGGQPTHLLAISRDVSPRHPRD